MITALGHRMIADADAADGAMFVNDLDTPACKQRFDADDEFLFLDEFLPGEIAAGFQARIPELADSIHRNFIPRHKKGGSVSRHTLDRLAPEIPALYRNPSFIAWLEKLTGETLEVCPESDPHAYALYFYTEVGDHIGWHFDTSYYAGKRYTLLLGIIDESSAKLEFELFKNDDTRQTVSDARSLRPDALCFFNGDKVWHRITPLGENERRISLTFEYVTDARMGRWQRFISNMKDSIAYFGFKQVFKTGLAAAETGATVVVDITLAAATQMLFGVLGLVLLLILIDEAELGWGVAVGIGVMLGVIGLFYRVQRGGLFGALAGAVQRLGHGREWLDFVGGGRALDRAIEGVYARPEAVARALVWRLTGWLAGVGEVWLGLYFLGHPVGLADAVMLEALGQAIRGAAFAIPGALGVQEGGFVLLASLIGLGAETGLALSLIKRVRELALGIPGLIAWQWAEGRFVGCARAPRAPDKTFVE